MATLHYDNSQNPPMPVVWVCKNEYGVDVFFEEENAKAQFKGEYERLKKAEAKYGYELIFDDSKDNLPAASWRDNNGNVVCVYVGPHIICDWYK